MKVLIIVCIFVLAADRASSSEYDEYYDDDYEEEEEIKVIEAPVEYIRRRDRIVKLKAIGPTAWVCVHYDEEEPWHAYEALEKYLEGNNQWGKKFTKVSWPMLKTIVSHGVRGITPSICHYMDTPYHCDMPEPKSSLIKLVTKQPKRYYWAHEFWGKASDRRIRYVINRKLKRSFRRKRLMKKINFAVAYQATFANNLKEVGYHLKDQSKYSKEIII